MQRDAAALKAALADLEQRNLKRRRRADVRGLVNFCSNDYLGLKDHPEVIRAFIAAAETHGVGSGAADLVTGHGPEHAALEEELAAFTGREKALVFSTGYMANMGVISALADQKTAIVSDKLNHASLIDGCRLSGADVRRYRHIDSAQAAELLASAAEDTRLLVTDGVFSMDGDIAPLPELARAARDARAWLVVDDAHGFGVVGATGRGCCELFGLGSNDVPVLVGTFGKAFGTFGAFVAGDADLIEFLLQKSRTYIYTTALPPAVAAATRAALRISQSESWRRERVRALAMRLRTGLRDLGIGDTRSDDDHAPTSIVPVILGEPERALAASAALEERGFLVTAIRPPTVPPGTARLRVTFTAQHPDDAIERLADIVRDKILA